MKRILVDSCKHYTRIGLVENGELIEFIYKNSENKSIVGNIYVGRVMTVHKGMQACFVDIGQDKNAYLIIPKGKNIQAYSHVLVQVQKDASGTKGAGLTDKISFPGKFLVLLPNEKGNVGISQKINNEEERERIKAIINEMTPEGYGIIVRTEGFGKTEEEFREEIDTLFKISQDVLNRANYAKAPNLVFSDENTTIKAARDLFSNSVDQIILNNKEEYELIKNSTTNKPERVIFYDNNVPMFENFLVESQVEKIFHKKIWLKSGGFLIIEQTEACVVIDVNTGKYTGKRDFQETIFKINCEAAAEIAKQLRLRNLSGMIIIDFIDMKSEENKQQLKSILEREVRKDRIKTNVVGLTELGLMQVTRKKTSVPISQNLTTECQCCKGYGYVINSHYTTGKIRREIEVIFSQTVFNEVIISSNKKVLADFAGYKNENIKELEEQFNKKIILNEIFTAAHNYYEIERFKR
ncbi:MAG: Rne/Rng family ribonuclease [Anaerotignaceae bacterium]